MLSYKWVLADMTSTEKIYKIQDKISSFIEVCSPEVNDQLNKRYEILCQSIIVGFYLIKDIKQEQKYFSETFVDVARYSYKENLNKKFIDMGLSKRIQPLFNYVSECLNGDKLRYKENPNDLINQIIHVHSCNLVDTTFNGKTSNVNQVKWSFISDQTIIKNDLGADPDSMGFSDFDEMDPEELFDPENIDPEELFDEEGYTD